VTTDAVPHPPPDPPPPRRVVLVTGLSGAGRSSMLHMLEDLGYEAVDNPPLRLMEEMVSRGDRPVAVGIDTRSRGFDVATVLAILARLRINPALRAELVFASAEESVLLRRYTETRRRHPLAPNARVVDGIKAETSLLAPLREAADLVLDTTDLPLAALRTMMDNRFGVAGAAGGMTLSLTSFAYPKGLPRDADLVFDMRFLRNPHYDPILRPRTGLDPEVAAYVEADPAFEPYLCKITDLLRFLLPRFVEEGKKYANIAIGCTGGRHRSVHVVQRLAVWLNDFSPDGTPAWRVMVNHRELLRGEPKDRVDAAAANVAEGNSTGGPVDTLAQTETAGARKASAVSASGKTGLVGATNAGASLPAQAQEA
jgi:UPF0042 nucleotide-binding protein